MGSMEDDPSRGDRAKPTHGGPIPLKLRVPVLAVAACSLVLSGCGGDAASEKPAGPSLKDAEAVVLDYFAKAFSADPAACEHESAAYAAKLDEENVVESCEERIEAVKVMLSDGQPLMDPSKTVVTVTEADGGALAEVTHEIDGWGGAYELVVEDGVWLIDGEVESADEAGFGVEPREVSEEEAKAVAKAFCGVEPGVSREQVEEWLGDPSAEQVDDDGTIEVDWFLNDDIYTVWFDGDDKVTQSSGSSPREEDPCA